MKTIVIKGQKQVEVIDVPVPEPYGNQVLVKIHSAPMCTEYRKFFKGESCSSLGHEAAGEVVAAFPGSSVSVGDRVIVMPQYPCGKCTLCLQGDYIHCENVAESKPAYGTGTFAEYTLKPDWLLLPIPSDISYDEAAMACCALGPALGAGAAMNVGKDDTVLVTGLGPVGLGAVIYCTYRGAQVIGIGRSEYRLSLAASLGAGLLLHPDDPLIHEKILAFTGNKGVDKAVECAGETIHQHIAINAVKRKGSVAFVGESGDLTIDVSKDLLRKGLTIHGIWHWNLNLYPQMIDAIRSSKEKLRLLITHKFPLENVEEAFYLQASGNCGKIVLQP